MNTAFLEALKKQGELIQQKRVETIAKKVKPATRPVVKTLAEVIAEHVTPERDLVREHNASLDATTCTLEIVVDKNRLDLFFNGKPNELTLKALRRNGWWFRASDKAWQHKDCEKNREFARNYFKMSIEPLEQDKPIEAKTVEPTIAEPTQIAEPVSPEFDKYRKQVNELLDYLKCEPADLILISIETLHNKTFSRPN